MYFQYITPDRVSGIWCKKFLLIVDKAVVCLKYLYFLRSTYTGVKDFKEKGYLWQ